MSRPVEHRTRHLGTRGMPRAEREAGILDAATAEFGARGYHAVSVDAIASRAGISKPLVHAYFGTKDALYGQCAERLVDRLVAAIAPVVQHAEPGMPMALETMRTIFTLLRDRPHDWMLIHDPTLPAGSEAALAAARCRDRMTELGAVGVRAALTASLARADVDAPADPLDPSMMNHVWQSVVTSLMTWWYDHPDQSPADLTARFGRILLALVEG